MKKEFVIGTESYDVLLNKTQGQYHLNVSERQLAIQAEEVGRGEYLVHVDGRKQRAFVAVDDENTYIHIEGKAVTVQRIDLFEKIMGGDGGGGSDSSLLAPMPGTVISVNCEPGQQVAEGDVLMVIESMKLETTVAAPRDGIVEQVNFSAGDTFDQKALLVSLKAEGE
ncbi:MAG: biotin/lipoyl-binding protein [Gammaproteobacteria bacterium]|nr:biotin/lipoyl-binding protein [Gammaproteobacteria bacterium]